VYSHIVPGSGGTGKLTEVFFKAALIALCHSTFKLADVGSTDKYTVVPPMFNTEVMVPPVLKAVGNGQFLVVAFGASRFTHV
jgi:hypothetical protein